MNGFRFALERDLEKLTALRATFLEDAARLEKITADAKPEDVDAAGRCGARAFWAAANSATFSSTRKPRTRDVTTRRLRAVHAAERRP